MYYRYIQTEPIWSRQSARSFRMSCNKNKYCKVPILTVKVKSIYFSAQVHGSIKKGDPRSYFTPLQDPFICQNQPPPLLPLYCHNFDSKK